MSTSYPVNPNPTLISTGTLGNTERTDAWWLEPTLVVLALIVFGIYGMWAGLQGVNFQVLTPSGHELYLSPFYSPLLVQNFPVSPAILVMWIPLGFRATCYFYRRCYHRAFFMNPPSCAVTGMCTKKPGQESGYTGEQKFPFILNNLHRYFLYLAIILTAFHWYHTVNAFSHLPEVGLRAGMVVFLIDAIFLSLYVFSCHSWRHWLGGKLDKFTANAFSKLRYAGWLRVSHLNENHGLWAWISLFTVGFADFYVRMVASGAWQDIKLF
ncbi:MAG: hypothetical protein VKJ06_00610 [Vampirovibrionales bacterium]|nr:hypothetical protein [Vampirovibrionales bacterium]